MTGKAQDQDVWREPIVDHRRLGLWRDGPSSSPTQQGQIGYRLVRKNIRMSLEHALYLQIESEQVGNHPGGFAALLVSQMGPCESQKSQ